MTGLSPIEDFWKFAPGRMVKVNFETVENNVNDIYCVLVNKNQKLYRKLNYILKGNPIFILLLLLESLKTFLFPFYLIYLYVVLAHIYVHVLHNRDVGITPSRTSSPNTECRWQDYF